MHAITQPRFRLFPVRSPLLRKCSSETSFYSSGYLDVSVHLVSLHAPESARYTDIGLYGFPHSDISGSKPVCDSPKLIAAYHVLHRLLVPRHPPYTLSSLTKKKHLHLNRLTFYGYILVVKELTRK